jgi:phage N-6-adenine-methyltransferase
MSRDRRAVEGAGPSLPAAVRVGDAARRGHKLAVHFSSGSDEWAAPQTLFDQLNAEFGFDLDVCASAANAKCQRYFARGEDGLAQKWQGSCWMNPPYGRQIERWLAKASVSARAGATVVALVPARVDTGWWWDFCRFAEIRFLRGRLRFEGAAANAPFPSAVVVFGARPRVVWWERPRHQTPAAADSRPTLEALPRDRSADPAGTPRPGANRTGGRNAA